MNQTNQLHDESQYCKLLENQTKVQDGIIKFNEGKNFESHETFQMM